MCTRKKTIAKFFAFVIFIGLVFNTFAGCSFVPVNKQQKAASDLASPYGPPQVVGKIASKDITESSGIAASKCQTGVFWTHNDSGDDAFIFAINEKGDNLGTWRVQTAENLDWEDIAEFRDKSGKCFIYIGEIGDNKIQRPVHAIYKVPEPVVSDASANTTIKDALMTEPAEQMRFSYPDHNQNAETLMVHPATGDIYVLTKRLDGPAGIYKLKPSFDKFAEARTSVRANLNPSSDSNGIQVAEKIGELAVPNVPNGFLTGGDISPDGKHVAICDYSAAYELTLPANSPNFDDIWKQTPVTIDRGRLEQGEAVGYTADGNSLILTSEKKNSPVVLVQRQKHER